jgi:hypothetical protein
VHFLGSADVVLWRSFDPAAFVGQWTAIPIWYGAALVFPVAIWAGALLRGGRGTALGAAALVLGAAVAFWVLPWGLPARRFPPGLDVMAIATLGFAGAFFLWALLLDPRRWRPGDGAGAVDAFLALWLVGWLVFSAFVNWHVNAADALLAAPPALLLLFRHPWLRPGRRFARGTAAASGGLALLLAVADAEQADFHREVAAELEAAIGEAPGRRWLVGNWGFQHYAGRRGFEPVLPVELGAPELATGDWLAAPRNVAQQDVGAFRDRFRLERVARFEHVSALPLRTTNPDAGAGFYSHRYGYTPFAFGTRPVEVVDLMRVITIR